MPVVESFVGVIGSVASMIGLSVQLYDRAKTGSKSSDDELVGIFVALTDVTKTWKSIHNEYHVLAPDIRKISKSLSDGHGGVKSVDDILEKELIKTFRDAAQIAKQAKSFSSKLDVYFQEPARVIEHDPQKVKKAITEIRDAINLNVSQAAHKIHQSQLSALEAHANVCEFLDVLAPLLRRSSWTLEERGIVLDKFLNFPGDFESVILDCDMVLLNTITLYEYVSSDLLESSK